LTTPGAELSNDWYRVQSLYLLAYSNGWQMICTDSELGDLSTLRSWTLGVLEKACGARAIPAINCFAASDQGACPCPSSYKQCRALQNVHLDPSSEDCLYFKPFPLFFLFLASPDMSPGWLLFCTQSSRPLCEQPWYERRREAVVAWRYH